MNDNEHGEGNYKATEDYNERTKEFIESGKVRDAAEAAKPQSDKEAREMREAEKAAAARAAETDPEISGGGPLEKREES